MIEQTPALLDRLDDLPVGTAPVDDLLTAGHRARRRRNTRVAGATLATVMVLGGSGIAAHTILPFSDSSRPGMAADPPTTTLDLTARAFPPNTANTGRLLSQVDARGGAVWNKRPHLVYLTSSAGYSSSCPPEATATITSTGLITITLHDATDTGPCTADASRMLVIIQGVTQQPTGLQLTENGKTTTQPIPPWTPDDNIPAYPVLGQG